MTAEINTPSDHLNSAGPSPWVLRHEGRMLFAATKSRDVVRWLTGHLRGIDLSWTMKDAINRGYIITRSYTVRAGTVKAGTPGSLLLDYEEPQFDEACDRLRRWVQRQWTADQDNHPTVAGREAARVRWHDADALLHLASLSMLPNPSFHYDFGKLTPPEAKGRRLVITIDPTPIEVLMEKVSHRV